MNMTSTNGLVRRLTFIASLSLAGLLAFGCSGGGGGGEGGRPEGSSSADFSCDGNCQNQNLSAADVRTVLSNAIRAASLLGVNATFAIVDRVGNVLAVYQMDGAPQTTAIDGQIGAAGGLEGLVVPSTLAAISKAGTGAYLSSQGNAFSTRTASQIVQEHFNPGERGQPGGPLFGVQFSQLMCGDVTVRNPDVSDGRAAGVNKFSAAGTIGPRALPLGLAADPGGLPLYKRGDLVGGIGVEFDGAYTLDRDPSNYDDDAEERLAMMATLGGFEAPSQRVAPNMNVGKSLRYTDLSYDELDPLPEIAVDVDAARLVAVPEFSRAEVREGAVYGSVASGVAKTSRAGVGAAVLVRADGSARFPSRAATAPVGVGLSSAEVEAILDSAILTATRARAAIRRPLDTPAQVTIWVVDANGEPLGMTRTPDAPVFGIDVALQKARAVNLMSSPQAGAILGASGLGGYVAAAQSLAGGQSLSDGVAYANRSIANLARPFLPDGIDDTANGPFSLPYPGLASGRTWSPFNTGLQLDIVFGGIAEALQLVPAARFPDSCAGGGLSRLAANGIQIFPGAVPLYRGTTLIGGIGISGDGVDQDDLIAFYGASRRGLDFAGHTGVGDAALGFNAPIEIRADTVAFSVDNFRLRYVNCPEAPFSGDNDQNVCDGL